MRKVFRFLKEARAELAKVVWPTRQRAARLTILVVVITIIFGAFIAAVDFGLGRGIEYVIDTTQKKRPAQTVPQQQPNPAGPQPAPPTQ